MSHQIELKEIQKWMDSNPMKEIASSTKDNKILYATFKGSFEVHKNGKVVHATMQPFSAVEHYNSI